MKRVSNQSLILVWMLPKKVIAYIDCRQKLTVLDFRTALKSLFAFQQRIFMLSHMFEQLTD